MAQVRITHKSGNVDEITTSGATQEIQVQQGDKIEVLNATFTSATVDGNNYVVTVQDPDGAIVQITFVDLFLLLAVGDPTTTPADDVTTLFIGETEIASIGDALGAIAPADGTSGDGQPLGEQPLSGGAHPPATTYDAPDLGTDEAPKGPLGTDLPSDEFPADETVTPDDEEPAPDVLPSAANVTFIHDETDGEQNGPIPTDDDRGAGANPDNDDVGRGDVSQAAASAATAATSDAPLGQAKTDLSADGDFAFADYNFSPINLFTGGTADPHQIFLQTIDDNTVYGFSEQEELVFVMFYDADADEIYFFQYQEINHDVEGDFDEDNPEAGADETVTLDYTVTNSDGSSSATVTVEIQDDGPVVFDENAGMLNENSIEDSVGGSVSFDVGTDNDFGEPVDEEPVLVINAVPEPGAGPITGLAFVSATDPDGVPAGSTAYDGVLRSGGEEVVFGDAVMDGDDLVLTGTADGDDVIEIRIDTFTGDYEVTLLGPIDHPDEGETDADDPLDITFSYTVTDGDGDSATGEITVNVKDDGPTLVDTDPLSGTVHEDALDNFNQGALPIEGSTGNDEGGKTDLIVYSAADLLALVDGGADEPITFSLTQVFADTDTGLTSQTLVVSWVVVNPTLIQGVASDGRIIFTLEQTAGDLTDDPADDQFTFTLLDQVDNPTDSGDSDTTPEVDLGDAFVATDFDGDSVVLNGQVAVAIENDVPNANADTDQLDEGDGNTTNGNVITGIDPDADAASQGSQMADDVGADEDNTAEGTTVVGVEKGDTDTDLTDSGTLGGGGILGDFGTLVLNANGSYTYSVNDDVEGTEQDIFTYTIVDADGDLAHTTLTITVNGINDPPVLDLDGDDSTTAPASADYNTSFTEGDAGVAIADIDSSITDLDDTNMELATITLTNAQVGDSLTVDAGALLASFGIVAVGDGTSTITLTGSTSLADYEAAIKSIQFANGEDDPDTTTREVDVVVNDGDANSNTATAFIAFNAENDPPVLDLDGDDSTTAPASADYNTSFTEGDAGVAIADIDSSITDLDDTNMELATITLTNAQVGDSLTVDAGALLASFGIVAVGDGTSTITLTGSTSLADYEAAIELIQFANGEDDPDTTTREVDVVVNDGDANSNTATAFITFNAVNDDPDAVLNTYSLTEAQVEDDVFASPGNALGNIITDDETSETPGVDSDPDGGVLSVTQVTAPISSFGVTGVNVTSTTSEATSGDQIARYFITTDDGVAELIVESDGDVFLTSTSGDPFKALSTTESGEISFTYTLSDGQGGTDTALVTIAVDGTNDVAEPDPMKVVWLPDNNDSLNVFDPVEMQGYPLMIAAATDVDGDTLTYDVTAVPDFGMLYYDLDGTGNWMVADTSTVLTDAQLESLRFVADDDGEVDSSTFSYDVLENGVAQGASQTVTINDVVAEPGFVEVIIEGDQGPNNKGNEFELPFFSGDPGDNSDVSFFADDQVGDSLQGVVNPLMLVRTDHDDPFVQGGTDHFGGSPGGELNVYLAIDLDGDGLGPETEDVGNQQQLDTYDALFSVALAGDAVEANATATVTDTDGVLGLAGDDSVVAGAGGELLFGGEGDNTLDGGAGADTFAVIFADGGVDTIDGFDDGTDLIGLVDLEFSDLTLVENGGNTEIYSNSVLLAVVLGVVGLTSADFDTNVDPFWFDTGGRTTNGNGTMIDTDDPDFASGEVVWGLYADGDHVFQTDTTTGDPLMVTPGTGFDTNSDGMISLNEFLVGEGGIGATDLWEFIYDDSTGGNQQGRFAAVRVSESGPNVNGDGGIVVDGTADKADLIFGSTMGDSLSGNSGDDVIFGDGGNDTINGGAGNDVIDGGTGDDSFVYDGSSDIVGSIDTILDFGAGDTFDFSGLAGVVGDVSFDTSLDGDIIVEFDGNSIAELDNTAGFTTVEVAGGSTIDEVALTIV